MSISVAEAAARHGVSPQRIRALIASGQLRAERAGRDWRVDPVSLEVADSRSSRPLSSRMAVALVAMASGGSPEGLDSSERSRAGARLARLKESPEPARLLRSWLANLEPRRLYVCKDLEFLREEQCLRPAGVSLPGSELNGAGFFEARVDAPDLDDVVARHMLREGGPAEANVVLHVAHSALDPDAWLLHAFYLAQHGDRSGREDAAVAKVVADHA
ncbi:helix-turn-helix domain-containing protein [Demequina sp. TTPB684]|uniref:helix-turn-helix domain-containing protein n=1 Tax=unclassified Demequina TaxID=2620311 RepID=UPI001CF5129D|nr:MULTISPECIES: helix-turn-helix domain-containing protein [unclassified Demequina]MCB2412436.1 helix-turn-helix domain-containing protein [Demequina sp. TTPB684]UPU88948.1 helix-turn-helix domain-containing protein [Demequina sp. TMPB413]